MKRSHSLTGRCESTLHLVKRQHEVLFCRYVLQNHRQLSSILHGGVRAALHLRKTFTPRLVSVCLRRVITEGDGRCVRGLTLGCRAYHSSISLSSSHESKVSSTSPRKLLWPKRSWCHTETCRLRVSSCEWLITYCATQRHVSVEIINDLIVTVFTAKSVSCRCEMPE